MKSKKLLIFANDPLKEYCKKGELIDRYFNPGDFFDEVYFISLTEKEIEEEKIQHTAGRARVKIYPISKIGPWIFFPFSANRKKILRLVNEIKPDCIRTYNAHVQGFLGAIISDKLGIPLVVSLHTHPEKSIRAFLNPFIHPFKWVFWNLSKYIIEPFVMNRASKIICVYNFVYEFAKSLCKDRTKIEVIYNRIDMHQFAPTIKSDKKNKTIKILCVGRLFEQKNPEYLIKAMRNIDAELMIIGDGHYRKRLIKIVETLNLDNKVYLIPSVPNKEIHKYYQESDIFVSVNDAGGVSKVVIEAMASGLPVIVTQPLWESYPELLGDTALITENSPDAFVNTINKLIANPLLRANFGDRNREKALAIDGTIMEQKEMGVYKNLLNNLFKRV